MSTEEEKERRWEWVLTRVDEIESGTRDGWYLGLLQEVLLRQLDVRSIDHSEVPAQHYSHCHCTHNYGHHLQLSQRLYTFAYGLHGMK